ncbi:MAG: hypothetical protein M3N04_01210 [Actinomycetota bacterium]|nr:hypothetical protein [Actinomycetota bacterium]
MSLRFGGAVGCAIGLGLVLPAAASAAVKTVSMGPPPSAGEILQRTYSSDANAFFPSAITIRVGDRVRFVPAGFHTVHFPGKSGRPGAPFVPTGQTIAGVNDEAGAPFWFNGQPQIGSNPQVFGPGGKLGKTVVTDGTKEIQSGAPLSNRPKPMIVRFTKAGRFRYFCDIHPGMTGSVRVAAKRRRVASRAADARRVRRQIARAIAVARSFRSLKAPANTVNVGWAGRGGVSLLRFVPGRLTVPVGTTVTFRMKKGDTETHTASTGPGSPMRPNTYLGKIHASLEGPAPDPKLLYPSDPPAAPAGLTPALHGNGFWNSGVIDGSPFTPLRDRARVTFAAAGTYTFFCLIHPFMQTTIKAQ